LRRNRVQAKNREEFEVHETKHLMVAQSVGREETDSSALIKIDPKLSKDEQIFLDIRTILVFSLGYRLLNPQSPF
jgi:hypothetical protein